MKPLGDAKRHFFLVKRMARATGADLDGAMHDGRLSETEWAETVTRCRGCACADQCENWLADSELAEDGLHEAPDYCENRSLFPAFRLQAAE